MYEYKLLHHKEQLLFTILNIKEKIQNYKI